MSEDKIKVELPLDYKVSDLDSLLPKGNYIIHYFYDVKKRAFFVTNYRHKASFGKTDELWMDTRLKLTDSTSLLHVLREHLANMQSVNEPMSNMIDYTNELLDLFESNCQGVL